MIKGLTRISLNSIRFKLLAGLMLVIIPTVFWLIYNNLYAIRVVHNQVGEYSRSLVSLYMNQIDSNLHDVDKYLTNLIVNEKDLQDMSYLTDEQEQLLAKVRLDNKMRSDIALYPNINSIFVYTNQGENYIDSFQNFDNGKRRDEARAYIMNLIEGQINTDKQLPRQWYVERIGGEYYLFRLLRTNDAYVGAWVSIKELSIPLNLINFGESGVSLFVDYTGKALIEADYVKQNDIDLTRNLDQYYISGKNDSFLVLGEKSQKGNFSLVALIPNDEILEKLPYFSRVSYAIPIAAIILIPACLLIFRRMFLKPLNRILAAMKRIGEGNLNVRIEPFATSDEFHLVNDTFNRMIKQVQELRIHVYEEQLNKQKAELQHLQLQINPHFFMNSLNIIYNLSLVRNHELIQEMTLSLVQYFRYMFRSNLMFVFLRDELKHVKNYFTIQQLRFPEKLELKLSSPDYLNDTLVPPLIIQTFVENAIKYASSTERLLLISVAIDLCEVGDKPMVQIVIKDTGPGFSEAVLKEIKAGNRIQDEQGEHIGIWNARRRLGLLYGDEASLSLTNGETEGAIVELKLPLQPKT